MYSNKGHTYLPLRVQELCSSYPKDFIRSYPLIQANSLEMKNLLTRAILCDESTSGKIIIYHGRCPPPISMECQSRDA